MTMGAHFHHGPKRLEHCIISIFTLSLWAFSFTIKRSLCGISDLYLLRVA